MLKKLVVFAWLLMLFAVPRTEHAFLVTRDDAMVQRLLLNKDDIYHDYHLDVFEREVHRRFETLAREELGSGTRFLYFLSAKSNRRRRGARRLSRGAPAAAPSRPEPGQP